MPSSFRTYADLEDYAVENPSVRGLLLPIRAFQVLWLGIDDLLYARCTGEDEKGPFIRVAGLQVRPNHLPKRLPEDCFGTPEDFPE